MSPKSPKRIPHRTGLHSNLLRHGIPRSQPKWCCYTHETSKAFQSHKNRFHNYCKINIQKSAQPENIKKCRRWTAFRDDPQYFLEPEWVEDDTVCKCFLSDWHIPEQPIAVQIKLMTPSLDNGEFIEASFGWCISCKYSSVFFTSAKIACLCFVCFPVPKKAAGDWMLAPFFVAKCASCKALAQNPVKHTCWIWTYSAPQRIGNNNLIGMLKHTHTHIRVSLLAQPNHLTCLLSLSTKVPHYTALSRQAAVWEPDWWYENATTPIRQGTDATCNINSGTFGACIEVMRYEIYPPQRKADMTGGDSQILQESGMIYWIRMKHDDIMC